MKVTRNTILDLLPLYIADEVSDDTRQLVEEFLEKDEGLRETAEYARKAGLKEVPMSKSHEPSLEMIEKTNRLMVIRTLVLAGIISISLLALLALGGALAAFFLIP
jgi:hypothetical protein